MPKQYTQGFKEQSVQKALSRGDTKLKTIALDLNIGYSTLQKWIREYKILKPENDTKRPQDWSREQQFQALMDTASMSAEQCSEYCREKGIFPHHLDEWRESFVKPNKVTVKSNKADVKSLKKENASLQREIRRKDKALAETAALLVLQKKFQALLEGKDE